MLIRHVSLASRGRSNGVTFMFSSSSSSRRSGSHVNSEERDENVEDVSLCRCDRMLTAFVLFYALAALALSAIIAPLKWRSSVPLAIATLILAIATPAIGSWVAYPGGHVRHKEFRFEPPPPARKP